MPKRIISSLWGTAHCFSSLSPLDNKGSQSPVTEAAPAFCKLQWLHMSSPSPALSLDLNGERTSLILPILQGEELFTVQLLSK